MNKSMKEVGWKWILFPKNVKTKIGNESRFFLRLTSVVRTEVGLIETN
jgi:hypothetical protein